MRNFDKMVILKFVTLNKISGKLKINHSKMSSTLYIKS